jgi:transposase
MLGPSLDEQVGQDCGVRRLDAMLRELDWSEWEVQYARDGAGRPPIHPRLMAGCILYGLLKGIRSTRGLEEATRLRLDFRWLLDSLPVDHTTICVFRRRFEGKVAELFKQLNRQAAALRQATLAEIMVDGTRIRADSDRHGARTGEALEKRLSALEAELGEALRNMEAEGEARADSREQLEKRLERLEAEKQKLVRALDVARERDEAKRRKDGAGAKPVRVPVTDPDASIMPNKEGGYAPNYTPVLAVDGASGLIVAACVAEGNAEAATVPELKRAWRFTRPLANRERSTRPSVLIPPCRYPSWSGPACPCAVDNLTVPPSSTMPNTTATTARWVVRCLVSVPLSVRPTRG